MSIVISNTKQRNNLINRDYAQNSEIILFKCIIFTSGAHFTFFSKGKKKKNMGGGEFKEKTPPT